MKLSMNAMQWMKKKEALKPACKIPFPSIGGNGMLIITQEIFS
jgi:hypothetical protein